MAITMHDSRGHRLSTVEEWFESPEFAAVIAVDTPMPAYPTVRAWAQTHLDFPSAVRIDGQLHWFYFAELMHHLCTHRTRRALARRPVIPNEESPWWPEVQAIRAVT